MSSKTAKSPKKSEPRTTIFVGREKLSRRLTLGEGREPVTDDQRRILMRAIHYKWPHFYELKLTDEVTETLRAIDIAWSA